jgi:hypothetical protein
MEWSHRPLPPSTRVAHACHGGMQHPHTSSLPRWGCLPGAPLPHRRSHFPGGMS